MDQLGGNNMEDLIKPGDVFECIEDVVMENTREVAFYKGKQYTCTILDCLTNEDGLKNHTFTSGFLHKHFTKVGVSAPEEKPDTETLIIQECDAIRDLLISKNRKYGDSAIRRGIVFDLSASTAIKARINDKLSRLKNDREDEDEDITLDLLGYFILLRISLKQEKV